MTLAEVGELLTRTSTKHSPLTVLPTTRMLATLARWKVVVEAYEHVTTKHLRDCGCGMKDQPAHLHELWCDTAVLELRQAALAAKGLVRARRAMGLEPPEDPE